MLGSLSDLMSQIPKLQGFAEQLAKAAQEMREEQKMILKNQKEILDQLHDAQCEVNSLRVSFDEILETTRIKND